MNKDNLIKLLNTLRTTYTENRVGPYYAWNKVSRTQVWQWCAAMGDENPLYLGEDLNESLGADSERTAIAPPTMLQSWTFRDAHGKYAPGSTDKNTYEVLGELDKIGYFGSVAVSYDQRYHHYLKEGDHVHSFSTIQSISELKTTGLGEGCFVTEWAEYFDQNERLIGEATITYLKYKPAQTIAAAEPAIVKKVERIRPVENHDSKHYWQGLRDGKLLLQQCSSCQTLRHPPQPMCEQCQSLNWQTIESGCEGSIYSHTTIHYPEIPPFDYPNSVVLVDLDEGVRIAAQLAGSKPEQIQIGQRVKAKIVEVQTDLSLPVFEVIEVIEVIDAN